MKIPVQAIREGDEYWGDFYMYDPRRPRLVSGKNMQFRVIRKAQLSTNKQLFDGDSSCVVVTVTYPDGSRGSRLYPTDAEIVIRRRK